MASLSTKIKEYAKTKNIQNIDFRKDVILVDNSDGNGPYIKEWNLDIPEPTADELDSFNQIGDVTESNGQIYVKRKELYGDWRTQLDEIYHDIDAWKVRIKTVKDKHKIS